MKIANENCIRSDVPFGGHRTRAKRVVGARRAEGVVNH